MEGLEDATPGDLRGEIRGLETSLAEMRIGEAERLFLFFLGGKKRDKFRSFFLGGFVLGWRRVIWQ